MLFRWFVNGKITLANRTEHTLSGICQKSRLFAGFFVFFSWPFQVFAGFSWLFNTKKGTYCFHCVHMSFSLDNLLRKRFSLLFVVISQISRGYSEELIDEDILPSDLLQYVAGAFRESRHILACTVHRRVALGSRWEVSTALGGATTWWHIWKERVALI